MQAGEKEVMFGLVAQGLARAVATEYAIECAARADEAQKESIGCYYVATDKTYTGNIRTGIVTRKADDSMIRDPAIVNTFHRVLSRMGKSLSRTTSSQLGKAFGFWSIDRHFYGYLAKDLKTLLKPASASIIRTNIRYSQKSRLIFGYAIYMYAQAVFPELGTKQHWRVGMGENKVMLKGMYCQCQPCSIGDYMDCKTMATTGVPVTHVLAIMTPAEEKAKLQARVAARNMASGPSNLRLRTCCASGMRHALAADT